jgi:phage terminase Nu1 subunit (DNA packaging protein)
MDDDQQLVTRARAAELLRRNGRTVTSALEDVPPDDATPGRPKRWRLATIKAALARRDTLNADYVRNGASASSTASLTAARARLTGDKARIVELQRKRLEGSLVAADEVEAVWAHQVAVVRTRLLAIPAKIAVSLGMATTAMERQDIVRREIHAALDELSRSAG